MRRTALLCLVATALFVACGKYGPPVRRLPPEPRAAPAAATPVPVAPADAPETVAPVAPETVAPADSPETAAPPVAGLEEGTAP